MLKVFRIIGFLEGISYLGLIGIGLPMKYMLDNDIVVKYLGMPHGLLFLFYLFIALVLKQSQEWSMNVFIKIGLASIIPFGTFYIDKKYLR